MAPYWHHQRTAPFFTQGKDSTQHNFSREERSALAILIREALQNALDARATNNNGPVVVNIRKLVAGQFDAEHLSSILPEEFRLHLNSATDVDLVEPTHPDVQVLVIEDFGTFGLQGRYDDPDADGKGENWNAFWLREGEGAKSRAGSLGGAGQGKVTYYKQSQARTVFGLTVRASDGERLLMGRANFLVDYHLKKTGEKYHRCAYFTTSETAPLPERGTAYLDSFSSAFALRRSSKDYGLSLVIPYARDFEVEPSIESVILEFYAPIVAGRLSVYINDTEISAATIDDVASQYVTDEAVIQRGSCFSRGYRDFVREIIADESSPVVLAQGWEKEAKIKQESFPEGALNSLREALTGGERVRIKLPLTVKKAKSADELTFFEAFIQLPPELHRTEESFLRGDLVIGGENPLARSSLAQKARSLTRIDDQTLSDFLLAAEEPSHLKWNASLARDKASYRDPEGTLRAVRQAVPRLLAAILGAETSRDVRALARFFGKPTTQSTGRKTQEGSGRRPDEPPPPPPPPPPPNPKYFRCEPRGTKVQLLPVPARPLPLAALPVAGMLELAYESDGDPFAEYDPFDFDLADTNSYPISAQGITIVSRVANQLRVDVNSQDFELAVDGFSEHMRLRARFRYDLNDLGTAALQDGDDTNDEL